jgi:hypothetical protein
MPRVHTGIPVAFAREPIYCRPAVGERAAWMFERLWRGNTPAAPAPREQLSIADLQSRAILVEAIARMDQRVAELEERPAPANDEAEIEAWQLSVAQSSNDIAQGLEQLADVCERISERLQEDRRDSQALREAIAGLASSQPQSLGRPAHSIAPAETAVCPVEEDGEDDEISLVDDTDHDEISLVDDTEADLFTDDPAERTEHQAAQTILEQLTEVLNRRGDGEALKLSTRLRRVSTSQWARLRDRGEDG